MGLGKVAGMDMKEPPSVYENRKGLHWVTATIFIIGDLAGGGMIALPNAFVSAGFYPGVFLICICSIVSTYTGVQLASCWTMMQRRWQKYHSHCRKPFGEMGYRACGPAMRHFLALLICLTQFGFATVLVLLAAKNLAILLNFFFAIKVSFCYLIVLVGFVIWPATMLKSPMHFWQIAVFSAASSSVAVVLLLIGMAHDAPVCSKEVSQPPFDLQRFFMSFGTMVFAFGGHTAFPTFQHDMKRPQDFVKSVYVAFAVIVVFYFSVSITGYTVYGGTVGEAVIPSVQLAWVQQTVNLMIALHVVTTVVIVFSPMTQQVEDMFKIPHQFGWQRFAIRSVLFWIIIFAALSLPNFGPLMDLIGASTMTLGCLILPSVFYLYLHASNKKRETDISQGTKSTDSPDDELVTWRDVIVYTPRKILIINLISITFGVVGGCIATVASLIKLLSSEVAAPCYVQYLRQGGLPFSDAVTGTVNCCGLFHNTTVSGISPIGYCAAARF